MKTNELKRYDAYKPSGIEWLKEIPKHWEFNKLGNLLFPVSQRNRTDLPLLSITREKAVILRDLDNDEENHNFIPDDLSNYKVLLKGQFGMNKMKAWQGAYGISLFDGIVSPAYFVFDLSNNVESSFFHWAIRSNKYIELFGAASDGVRIGQWDLSKERMKKILFLQPPKFEQTAIAQFLDTKTALIDKAIELKEKQIALLKERRQAIIHQAVTKGLNPDVPMKDSGIEWIGKIPEHWEVKKLKFILKTQGRIGFKGYAASDLVNKDEGALTLGASHFDWEGNLNLSERVYISWKKYYESPEIMINQYDILIVQRGSTCGKVALVSEDIGPATINPSLVLLKDIKENPKYVFLGIKVVFGGILNLISNTAIPMLSQSQLDNVFIPVPPKTEQLKIEVFVAKASKSIDKAVSSKQQEIEKLKEYKASLINSAVTGKIKVA